MKKQVDPERWRLIDQLLQDTMECDPQERRAFLENTCAGDEA